MRRSLAAMTSLVQSAALGTQCLGITGGIAAYKAPLLIRRLLECGAKVRVVRTATADQFVTDTTLSVLSQHPVSADLFAPTDEFPVLHVGLAEWAELFLVAPATAHTLGKMAHGLADDLLTCVYLATQAPSGTGQRVLKMSAAHYCPPC